jgi:adenylate cyclase
MERLLTLLDRYASAQVEEQGAVEAEIWETFGMERAILALDMSQFSLSVRRMGIVPYLAQIERMLRISRPIVAQFEGEVVKAQADNLMAIFPSPGDALLAARAIIAGLVAERTARPGPIPFAASIGIDFGKILHIPDHDCFGDAVNIAYKVGEDIARPDEILVTSAVRERVPLEEQERMEMGEFSVSGLALTLWKAG